jgi:hypothetical protein
LDAVEGDYRVHRLYEERIEAYKVGGFDVERVRRDAEKVEAMIKKGNCSGKAKDGLLMRSIVLKKIIETADPHNTTTKQDLETEWL